MGRKSGGTEVEIGVEKLAFLPQRLLQGSRITVEVVGVSHEGIKVRIVDSTEIGIYWGFHVSDTNLTLGEVIRKGFYDVVVSTSRLGKPLTESIDEIRERWRNAQRTLIAFGSPHEGLEEIFNRERLRINEVSDFVLNTLPLQGVETIRTEEAVLTTLAIINIIV